MTYIAVIIFEGAVQYFSIAGLKKLIGYEDTYIKELESILYEVVDEYESIYSQKSSNLKFPFYESKILFEFLTKRILLGENSEWDQEQLKKEISNNENIEIPTQEELEYFFSLLSKKIKNSKKLKTLYVKENFKQEIFSISNSLKDLKKQVESIEQGVDELKDIVKSQNANEIPILAEEYISREEEKNLAEILEEKGVLLLTGISFCGKSQLAKKLSLKYYQEGYLYKNTSDLKEADRFLRATNKNRIIILEDPFGHSLSSERIDGWRVLEEAIRNKPSSNKLIVTSKLDILKSTKRFKTLEDCRIKNNKWVDVTNTDPEFLKECWKNLCVRNSVPEEVREKISDYLVDAGKGKDILQVGQLSHLANISNEKIQDKKIDQLLHLARTDSKSIAIEVDEKGKDCSELFLALGLTARTNQPIHSEDLKFILSDTDVLPGFLKQTNDEFTFSSTETGNSKPDFPKYPTGIQFTSEYKSQLKFLQKRGFISIKSNQIWFNHPTYREAAKHLFFLDDIITSNNLNLFINRSLATLNPKSSACCAEQMRFIFDKTENPDTKKMILDLAFKAVQKSIFPGVRDKLFAFILDNINEFSGDHQEKVFRQLEYDFDANDIYWEDDIAYLGPRKIALPGEYGKKTEDLRQILEDINHQQVNISSIWNYIIGLQFNRIEKLPDQKGIIRILNVDEVFIRKRFALLIFSKSFPDDKVLEIIFHDEHPSVISSAIKGAIMGCPTYTENQKEKITNYINEAFKDPHVVIRSNNFMTSFSIDYGSESIAWKDFDKNEQRVMWDFWSSFFPNFLDNYPEDLRISNTGRFHAIFRDGLEYLSSLQGYKISKAFFKWIDKQLKFRMLDEFELDVMSFLIDVTENDEPIRYDLFRDILSHESSDLVACSFAEVIDRWDYLTKQEKDFCMNFLGFDRIDSRWMSAIALTQNKVPKRIQDYFFNEPNLFEKDTHVIVNSFDNDLLQDCLNIFCGYPQPFWWLGFHHRNRDFWYEVILWVVENEYKVGFEISLREIISAEVNGSNKFGDKGKEVWTKLCNDTKRKDLLLDRLLFETASTTYNTDSTKELWSPLIEVYKKENNIERLLDGIESHINNIQNKVKNGLYEIFGTEFLVEYLLPRFPADNLVVRSLLLFSDEDNRRGSLNNSKAREIIDNILEGIDSRDLKLIDTFNILQNVINKKSEEYPSLEKLSKLARHKRSVRMNRERLTEEYEINNWNHVHEN